MPTTSGMTENYNQHSEFQHSIFQAGLAHLMAALKNTSLPKTSAPFTIVDYGCAQGKNSIAAIRHMIETLRAHQASQPFLVVHNDLPTNNFDLLWQNLYDPNNTQAYLALNTPQAPIWPLCSGASFFSQVLPSQSVNCGITDSAVHWLSRMPAIQFSQGLYFSQASGEVEKEFSKVAAQDWINFLTARTHEIVPGGCLFIQQVGRRSDPANPKQMQTTAAKLFDLMHEIFQDLIREKKLQQTIYDQYIFPVVPRSLEEALQPLQSSQNGSLQNDWRCEYVAVNPVENPYYAQYLKDSDAKNYAAKYVEFVRAFSESSLLQYVFNPGAIGLTGQELAKQFYQMMQQQITANPKLGVFEDYNLTLVLRRC